MRETYKATKVDKARLVVCALWDMDKLPEEGNRARWKDVMRLSRRPMVELDDLWEKARKVINERLTRAISPPLMRPEGRN